MTKQRRALERLALFLMLAFCVLVSVCTYLGLVDAPGVFAP